MKKQKAGPDSLKGMTIGLVKEFAEAVSKGDIFVKLSLLWMGAGYAARKQYIKALRI